jgi:SAM-dependent methyltransferase
VEDVTGDGRVLSGEAHRWDGETGEKWVRNADRLDAMLLPFGEAIFEALCQPGYERPLDIGCGAGALTLRLGELSDVPTGVDVSSPLIALARQRAVDVQSPARFLLTDAASYQAEAPHDLLVSRFGVMFFEDSVAAFKNLRRAAREQAALHFVCWREPKRNPWASLPALIAREELGVELPQTDHTAPGPFAFAAEDRLASILADAGWRNVTIDALKRTIAVPGNSVEEASRFLVELGPLARHLEEAGIPSETLVERLCGVLPSDSGGRVRLPSEAWLVSGAA